MDLTYYRPGKGEREERSRWKKHLLKICSNPCLFVFLKKILKKVYGLNNSISISPGFYSDTIFLETGRSSSLANLYIHGLGDVRIGSKVSFSFNCEIITGSHDLKDFGKVYLKPTIIEDYACIFRGAKILHDVRIGRGAYVGADSLVRCSIPPYSIVIGNPCKVVGFRFTPDEAVAFEKEHFPEEQRIDIEILKNNYQKYYLKRLREIRDFCGI